MLSALGSPGLMSSTRRKRERAEPQPYRGYYAIDVDPDGVRTVAERYRQTWDTDNVQTYLFKLRRHIAHIAT